MSTFGASVPAQIEASARKGSKITNARIMLNKSQKKRGVDYACTAQGIVPYTAVDLTEFSGIITNDLATRHVQVPPGTKIKTLLVLLKT